MNNKGAYSIINVGSGTSDLQHIARDMHSLTCAMDTYVNTQ